MNEKLTDAWSDQKTSTINLRELLNEVIWNELTNAEKSELMNLFNEVEVISDQLTSPSIYYSQKGEDLVQARLDCDLRLKIERTEELLTGYPQTGSAASIAARRTVGGGTNPLFKLEQRIHIFRDRPNVIWEREIATFGDGAIGAVRYAIPIV